MDLSKYYNQMTEMPIANIKDLVIHHSAISHSQDPDIETIHQIHRGKGWICVGYHVFIKKDGTIQYGRPMNKKGAQAYGHNHEGLAVCLSGYFHPPVNDKPSTQQLESVIEVLRNWKSKIPHDVRIIGHRDYGGTVCPGDFFTSSIMEDIRNKVNTGQANPVKPGKEIFIDLINKYSKKYHLDPNFIYSIVEQESSFRPDVTSSSGAMGLMQLMPATFEECAVNLALPSNSDPYDPYINIHCGCYYFSKIDKWLFPKRDKTRKKTIDEYFILAGAYNQGAFQQSYKYAGEVIDRL